LTFDPFIYATDLHGDMQDDDTVEKLLAFTAIFKPKHRIFGGDLFDFRNLRKGASIEERKESMQADGTAGMSFLSKWKPTVYQRGNHCERLWELAQFGQGIEADYAQKLAGDIESACNRIKCKILPYHKREGVYRLGNLKTLHGFYCGVYATRQHAATYGACLHGHTHTIDEASVPGLERRTARGVGALCKLDMHYNSRSPNTLRQAHGWAYGVIDPRTGNYWVQQAEEIEGVWVIPSEFKQI
jgi:hypothetical protein